MRALASLALVALCGCSQYDPARYGTVRVAISDCREPQRGWIVAQLETMRAIGPGWVLVESEQDVLVICQDLRPGHAGEYRLGERIVRLDPTQAAGEFATRATVGHELVHWRIFFGPHPERARLHVCAREGADCWTGAYDRNALMTPSMGGGFDPGTDGVSTGEIPQHEPQWSDQRFFAWATGEQ